MTAIAVRGLRKTYGALEAVRGIDFEIAARRGLRPARPERRRQDDDGRDPRGLPPPRRRRGRGARRRPRARRRRVARADRRRPPVARRCTRPSPSTEMLRLFAGYYREPRPVDEVIELVGLEEKRDDRVRRLSGGQRRRLDLGLALVGDPELIFLDEPTTGFDPAARRRAWETIRVAARPRQDDPADDALPRRGRAARRPRRACCARADRRDGHARRADRPGPATEIRYRENGREVVLETEEPTRVLDELTGARARRRAASSRASSCAARRSRRSTSS